MEYNTNMYSANHRLWRGNKKKKQNRGKTNESTTRKHNEEMIPKSALTETFYMETRLIDIKTYHIINITSKMIQTTPNWDGKRTERYHIH